MRDDTPRPQIPKKSARATSQTGWQATLTHANQHEKCGMARQTDRGSRAMTGGGCTQTIGRFGWRLLSPEKFRGVRAWTPLRSPCRTLCIPLSWGWAIGTLSLLPCALLRTLLCVAGCSLPALRTYIPAVCATRACACASHCCRASPADSPVAVAPPANLPPGARACFPALQLFCVGRQHGCCVSPCARPPFRVEFSVLCIVYSIGRVHG